MVGHRVAVVALLLVEAPVLSLPAEAEAMERVAPIAIDIAAQPLTAALNDWARQTGLMVLVPGDEEATRIYSPPVHGTLTPAVALERLLSGSPYRYRFVSARTVSVFDPRQVAPDTASDKEGKTSSSGEFRLAQVDQETLAGPSSVESNSPQDSAQSTAKLDEVIVTAQKRGERLQDVPISIAVVGADEIQSRQLVNAEDYLRGVPGVSQTTDLTGQSIIIRGIETQPYFQNYGAGTTVATYFGETETTSSGGVAGGTAVDIKLVDIARVEVLRGPQGTAFGNQSLGGAVRTIPVEPKLGQWNGDLSVGYSGTAGYGGDNTLTEGVLNIPLGARVAIRAVGYRFSDSGYYKNIAGSDPTTRAIAAGYGASNLAVNGSNLGGDTVTGGRVMALFQATDDLKLALTYLRQTTQANGFAQATRPGYQQTILQVGPTDIQGGRFWGGTATAIDLYNADVTYNLGWSDLVATYSYVKGNTIMELPGSVNPALFGEAFASSTLATGPQSTSSGEIRLVTRLNGAWNGIVGLYGEGQHGPYLENDRWSGTPATNPYNYPLLGNTWAIFNDARRLRQQAAYGELNWKPLSKLTLTGGVRAYHYKRSSHFIQDGFLSGGLLVTDRDVSASGTTKRGNISFKPNEAATLYASYAEGFRLGRPQSGVPATICDTNGDGLIDGTNISVASTQETKPDTVRSYELGIKTSLLDRRLQIDADVFHINWHGLPIYAIGLNANPSPLCSRYTANAGAAASDGIEFQASAQLTSALRFDGGFAVIHARLTEAAPGINAADGTQLPGSPKVNANLALEYGFQIAGHASTVRADAHYIGAHYGNFSDVPDERAGDYTKVDLSGRVFVTDQLTINPFVHNLFNSDAFTFRGFYSGSGPYYGWRLQPRTVGVQLDYKF